MAGGKVSVRQKMINMMYLVLTALLALNVSKDILHAFHLVEVSMDKSGINIDQKNQDILAAFKADDKKRHKKVGPYFIKAKKADKITKEFIKYVDGLKALVEIGADGRKNENDPNAELQKNDDIENHANLLIVQGEGAKLRAEINKTRIALLALLDKEDQKGIKSDLVAIPTGSEQSWEAELFEHSPAAAVVTLFAKIKNDAKNTEAQVLDKLARAIDKSSQTFDKVVAKIIPKSGFVMSGGKFKADIMLVAYDSKQQNDVIINGTTIKPVDGVAKYEAVASGQGLQKVSGYINFKGKDGIEKISFDTEYIVFKGAATISATKMNILYIGLPNPISISVPGFSPSQVLVSMPGATLSKKSSTEYIAKVRKRGKVKINVSVKMDDGSTKSMGSAIFRVRNIPKPVAQLGTLQNGQVSSVGTIRANANRIYGSLGESFAYEGIKYTVTIKGRGSNLSGRAKSLIRRMKSGDRVLLDRIKAKGPDGIRNLAPVIITAR